MKKLITTICIILSFSIAQADEALIIEDIVSGTIASSEKMNARFEAIEDIINLNLVTMYDYGTPAGMSKTFAHTNSPTTLTSIITEVGIETWIFDDGSKIEYLTKDGDDGTMETGRREYNTSGVMTQDLTYFPAVLGVDISGPKTIGKIWGNAYIAKKPDLSQYGAEVNMYSIIGIEDVTVPAGIFLNCTKVFHTTGNYKNVAWYAEGIGMVKRIGVNGLMELQGYVP